MTNSDISTQVSIFQPTVYINLDHEVVFRKNLMGIFILSLVIISYNYFSILTSQGKLEPAAWSPTKYQSGPLSLVEMLAPRCFFMA